MGSRDSLVTAVCLAAAVLLYAWMYTRARRLRPKPPGPGRKWPIIGNILQLPSTSPWFALTKWKEIYGDLVYLEGLGNSILVLSDMKAVTDLLDKRGIIYSHRPVLTMAGELVGMNSVMALMPPGKQWMFHRKLARIALGPESIKKYGSLQEDNVVLLLMALKEDPTSFNDHVRLAAGRLIISITYGLSVKNADDLYIRQAEAALNVISRVLAPGASIVDLIPPLKYLPKWLPFHKQAAKEKATIQTTVDMPFYHVKDQMKAGTASSSLTGDLLANADVRTEEDFEENLKWMSGALYGAGNETTWSTTLTFILLMALNPAKQAAAQAEIDAIVGADRLPSLADRARLPYVGALVKEVMRWHPSVPLGLPRRTAKDDWYNGYFIPAGTTVLPNVWAISQMEDLNYPPETFAPERFLEDGRTIDPSTYAFGFGRRICPGKLFAEDTVYLFAVCILSCFDISPTGDTCTKPEFVHGLVSAPAPFDCRIESRSKERVELIAHLCARLQG